MLDHAMKANFTYNWQSIAKEANRITTEKGFWNNDRNDGEMIALMHSELSEALEAHRKDLMDDKLPHRSGVEVEMADCIIRIMDYCYSRRLDVAGALLEKMQYNEGREYLHGKKY